VKDEGRGIAAGEKKKYSANSTDRKYAKSCLDRPLTYFQKIKKTYADISVTDNLQGYLQLH
jgi:hypothetical protein